MASIVLGSIGSAVGNAVGGSAVAMAIGQRAGQLVGSVVEQKLVGRGSRKRTIEGARLEELAVQTSTYGRVIPALYGTGRVAGNIIWARPIREMQTTTSTTTRSGGKGGAIGGGGGGGSTQTTVETSYSYYASLAVAICEGPVSSVSRVWADAKLLSLGQYNMRIYYGSETQLADSLIESYEGLTTAHRGLAYVVFEDFPLAEFGNRIPNFTFEVTRRVGSASQTQLNAEQRVTSVIMIPGSGEFVYDTVVQSKAVGEHVGGQWVQRGNQVAMNMHNVQGTANVNLALNQLQQTFPNLEYVGLVVNWFANSLDAATAVVEPCVEFPNTTQVSPNEWSVAGKTRSTARVISYDNGAPRYGGTPSDESILRLLQALSARGIKVFFYPMLLIDAPGKPWRGHMTCNAAAMANFFTKSNGYNAFIRHYAALTAGWVQAFAIGSEMKGLTKVSSSAGVYPAVNQLINLAQAVKGITPFAHITYAADWSEYHHADGGWYNLDPLWASSSIDFIGIDAYFPLTDAPQNGIDKQAIRDGWTSGEGYEWYYTNDSRVTQEPLDPPYAWKNIAWWWNNTHRNPNGAVTAWVPRSKKIWFTEYGFASVDGTTNQPNVFVDPTSSDSGLPRFSRARVDFAIQRAAIEATEEVWANSDMVARKFLWTWDARPYPQWPDLLGVWSDGRNWDMGHWVQGKLGIAQLGGAVRELLQRTGLDPARIDCSELTDALDGFILYQRMTVREALEQLMMAYPFDIVETGGILKAVRRGRQVSAEFAADECLPVTENEQRIAIEMQREQELELPSELEVIYLNKLNGYNAGTQRAFRHAAGSAAKQALKMAIVLSDQQARVIAERQLTTRWMERTRFQLQLPMRYAFIEPGDVLRCVSDDASYTMRVDNVQFGKPGIMRISAVEEDPQLYENYTPPVSAENPTTAPVPLAETVMEILDLPALPGDSSDDARIRIAACGAGENWSGAAIYQVRAAGDVMLAHINAPAVMGRALTVLPHADAQRIDEVHSVYVSLLGDGILASASLPDILGGANSALLGDEIIQFMTATALDEGKYRLSGLLRGRLGTEYASHGHVAGERFVLLDRRLASAALMASDKGRVFEVAAATYGKTLEPEDAILFTAQLRALQPYAPVHLHAVRANHGDAVLHWTRRSRIHGDWQDYQDIPLGEADERYDLEIMAGEEVVRSVRVTTPSYNYSAAHQVADFGGIQGNITIIVYQLSSLVGRGIAAKATV